MFTLSELLVVFAIFAILISLLSPALKKSFDHARNIGCVNNLKQINNAITLYKEDRDNAIVARPHDNPGKDIHPSIMMDRMGYLSAGRISSIEPISSVSSAYRCPEGLTDQLVVTVPTSDYDENARRPSAHYPDPGVMVYTWYSWNIQQETYNFYPNYGLNLGRYPSFNYVAIPDKSAHLIDGAYSQQLISGPYRSNARHFGFTLANILFYDGHVAGLLRAEFTDNGASPATNGWVGASTVVRDFGGGPVKNYTRVIWRKPSWDLINLVR